MTSRKTSELGYFVRGNALGGNLALDTAAVREGIVNNLNHLQDQSLQHCANWCIPTANTGLGTTYVEQAVTTVGTVALIDYLPPMPTLLHMQSDGSSSRIEVVFRAYIDLGTATFRVFLRPLMWGDSFIPHTAPVGTSATTIADVTCSSAVAVTCRAEVYVSRLTSTWLISGGIPALDGHAVAMRAQMYAGMVEIWATSTSINHHPRIESVMVREYVGG